MSTSTTWRDISEGSAVILKRQRYVVTNYARDGKRATVTVKGARGSFTTTVKRKDPVELAPASVILKRAPEVSPTLPYGGSLHDPSGAQRRWAEPGEVTHDKPPAKAKGGAWDEPKGKAERKVAEILGAHLVGESTDPESGWYVPEVDPSTIAAHLFLYHDLKPASLLWEDLSTMHADQHARALGADAVALHVNHWHTKQRPVT